VHLTDWAGLEAGSLDALSCSKATRNHEAGEILFWDGAPSEGLWCISEGCVGLRTGERLTRIGYAGDTLGLEAFFAGGVHKATAVTLSEARTCFFDRADIEGTLAESPSLSRQFLKTLSERTRTLKQKLVDETRLPIRERLVRCLRELAEHLGEGGEERRAVSFRLPLARRDLAALLGARPETLSRAIRGLARDRRVTFSGRRVTLACMDERTVEIDDACPAPGSKS
jgi:CRP/FNR family transcriptional regulator